MHIIEHHGENPWNSLNKWIVPRILMDFYRGNTSRINGKIPKKQQSLVAFNAGHGRKPETGRIRRIVVNKPMFQFPAVPFRNWLVVDLPLWKIWVNGKDDVPYIKWKINVWNHQPGNKSTDINRPLLIASDTFRFVGWSPSSAHGNCSRATICRANHACSAGNQIIPMNPQDIPRNIRLYHHRCPHHIPIMSAPDP